MVDRLCVVSVIVMAYNRVHLISKTLDSILAQKTNFAFEVVVGDDASTDGTKILLAQYQRRFPDKIRVRIAKRNEGICVNFARTYALCRGKYVAICDSDDQWIDPYKLARQVGFLEVNQDYNWVTTGYAAFVGAEIIQLNKLDRFKGTMRPVRFLTNLVDRMRPEKTDGMYIGQEYGASKFPAHKSTWLFRNQLTFYPEWYSYPHHYPDDYALYYMLSPLGRRYDDLLYISTAVHFQEGGWTLQHSSWVHKSIKDYQNSLVMHLTILEDLNRFWGNKFLGIFNQAKVSMILTTFKVMRRSLFFFHVRRWLYLVQLSAYIDQECLEGSSRKSGLLIYFNRKVLFLLNSLSDFFPLLFDRKLINPVNIIRKD